MEHSFLWFLLTLVPWDTWDSLVRVEELHQQKKEKAIEIPRKAAQLPGAAPCLLVYRCRLQ